MGALDPQAGREIVVRFSLGDLLYLAQAVAYTVRWRDPGVLRGALWVMRENRRRGTWRPTTLGDYVVLHRLRRHLSSWPRTCPRPAPWRHSRGRAGQRMRCAGGPAAHLPDHRP
jgi:uncharacterized protein YbdZ (MbtH family)